MKPRRIAQRENDRPFNVLRHLLYHLFGEGFRLRRGSDQHMRLDLLDHRKEIIMILALPMFVVTSEWPLAAR